MKNSSTNAIIYSLYSESICKKKGSLINSITITKSCSDVLEEDERIYALIDLIKLYSFSGYYPSFEAGNNDILSLVNDMGEVVTINIAEFKTEKDKAYALLDAVTYLPKYANEVNKKIAVFADLKEYYDLGKDFDSYINSVMSGKDFEKSILEKCIRKLESYLTQYSKETEDEQSNILNLVISEAKEDIEEILK